MRDDSQLISDLQSHIKTLQAERQPWESVWKEVWEVINPTRLFYGADGKQKDKKPKPLYNSRGIKALNTASSGFLGYTASRQTQWFKLALTGQAMELPGARRWLEQCEQIMTMEFNASNFYEALGELTPDIHAIGTGIIYSEEDIKNRRVVFQCRHPLAVWIAENIYGEVDTVHEDVFITYKAAMERFELSDDRQELGKKNPYEYIILKHTVIPATDEWRAAAKADPKMPYISVWYDADEEEILDIGGYWEFPFVVSRYMKNPGEPYGRGPGIDALGDILGAQQMTKSRLRLAQLIADPTLAVPEELEGQDDVIPGGRIYMPPNSGRIEPVQIGANYPVTLDTEQRTDEIISDHFNIQIYMMLQQSQGQMTAREVIERTGEKAAILGYVTGRFNTEVLQPLIKRTFNIMVRAGKLPPPPEALVKIIQPYGIDIEFMGLMAQMQKKYYNSNSIQSSLEYIGAMGQMFPEALDNVDGDGLLRSALESVGTPAAAVRDTEDVQELRMAKQQMMQQQQAMEQEMALMQNADKLGKPVAPNSPLAGMAQQAAQQAGQ
jgi:hypothetical protein